jgi:hypothetical protein
MDDARAGRTNVMCNAIGAGLVESFGQGNEWVMYAMARRQYLIPTTCTGERR